MYAKKAVINYGSEDIIDFIDMYELLETFDNILEVYSLRHYGGLDLIISTSQIYLVHNWGSVIVKQWQNLLPNHSFTSGHRWRDTTTIFEIIAEINQEILDCLNEKTFRIIGNWDASALLLQ